MSWDSIVTAPQLAATGRKLSALFMTQQGSKFKQLFCVVLQLKWLITALFIFCLNSEFDPASHDAILRDLMAWLTSCYFNVKCGCKMEKTAICVTKNCGCPCRMWQKWPHGAASPDGPVSCLCRRICETKCLFTAKDMTLEGYIRTKGSRLMNEGLALARYYDNKCSVSCMSAKWNAVTS